MERTGSPLARSILRLGIAAIVAAAAAGMGGGDAVLADPPAGKKVTICHTTGDPANPWVQLTVSQKAVPAHQAHGDFVVTAAAPCPPPPVVLDHFLCYTVDPPDEPGLEPVVSLQDQFDPLPEPASVAVIRPQLFCNPVDKNDEGIVDRLAHLTWYPISTGATNMPPRVSVSNQFGQDLILEGFIPQALAVPSIKDRNGDLANLDLDHFKCYSVLRGPAANRQVTLRDQFDGHFVFVENPVHLCNPTTKLHNRVKTLVAHPEDHLVCYTITRDLVQFRPIWENQFGEQGFPLRVRETLCVPSTKEAPTP